MGAGFKSAKDLQCHAAGVTPAGRGSFLTAVLVAGLLWALWAPLIREESSATIPLSMPGLAAAPDAEFWQGAAAPNESSAATLLRVETGVTMDKVYTDGSRLAKHFTATPRLGARLDCPMRECLPPHKG